jgi:hypothetical protein
MTSVTISLYLPLSTLAGQGISSILRRINQLIIRPWRYGHQSFVVIAILASAFVGGRKLIPLLNPITMLVRGDDLQAMEFIRSEIKPQEKFLIQPFLWGYGLYAGSDGGSWIPALAQHPTIPPPVIFALTDSTMQIQQINRISQKVLENPRDALYLANLMKEYDLTYLYLGAKGGAISPSLLRRSPLFKLIYHHGRVFIFERQSP